MDKHQFSGKNLEDALNEAAKYFSVDKAFVCYNTLTKTNASLFSKIFSRGIQIEAWVEKAKEDLQEAARKAVREALDKPKTSENKKQSQKETKKQVPQQKSGNAIRSTLEIKDAPVKSLLENYNKMFFSAFSLSSENYSLEIKEKDATIHVENDFLEDLLTKSDKLSLAYEHVFKRISQKMIGDISGRLTLDAGSSLEKREERLVGIAKSLAEKVRKTGKSVVLSSKSSQERRIIHLALDGFEGIGTRSVGMGDKRRLVIFSHEKASRADTATKRPTKKYKVPAKKPAKNSQPSKKNHLLQIDE